MTGAAVAPVVAPNAPPAPLRASRLPASQVLAYTVTNGCQGVMLTLPFTVAVFMVRSWLAAAASTSGEAADEAQTARLTGYLAASYSFSQFTTSFLWGVLSSRFGRKPVMVIGSAASAVALVWFGLSGSFASALASRCVAGLLNATIVAWKSAIGESCDAMEQGRVLSLMSLAWGIGCVVGPSLGGLLSDPCTHFPSLLGCAPGGLLQARPYFLPCAIAAAMNGVAVALNVLLMRETLPQLVEARAKQQQGQQEQQEQQPGAAGALWRLLGRRQYQPVGSSSSRCADDAEWQLWRAESGLATLPPGLRHEDSAGAIQLSVCAGKLPAVQEVAAAAAGTASSSDEGDGLLPPPRRLRPNDSVSEHVLMRQFSGGHKQQQEGKGARDWMRRLGDSTLLPDQHQHSSTTEQQEQDQQQSGLESEAQPLVQQAEAEAAGGQQPSSVAWYRQPQVLLVLCAYGSVSLLFCAMDELLPIFASAPLPQGGLSMSAALLAGPLVFGGACLIFVALFLFPPAQRALSTLGVTRLGLCLAVGVCLALPCTRFVAAAGGDGGGSIGPAAWLLLYGAMLGKAVAGCGSFTGTMILVNLAAPQEGLGAVNGVGQSLASLARGIGPACAGWLWSLTVHAHGEAAAPSFSPLAVLMPFLCVASIALLTLALYANVRPHEGEEVARPAGASSCCQK